MGSKMGWILGILMLVVIAVFVAVRLTYDPISPPTAATRAEGFMEQIEVDVPPAEVTGMSLTAPGNAGEDFAEAVRLARSHEEEIYDQLGSDDLTEVAQGLKFLPGTLVDDLKKINEHVADGARKAEMNYAFRYTPESFEVGFFYGPAEDFDTVYQGLRLLTTYYYGRKEYDQAADVMRNAYMLGYQMTRDRVRPHWVLTGLNVMAQAVIGLQDAVKKDGDTDAAVALTKVYRDIDSAYNRYEHKCRVVWSVNPEPGDLYNILANHEDRAMRVQALLGLGVVRYTHASKSADMEHVQKLIQKYLQSDDPYLVAAAEAAKNMTKTDFRSVHNR